jgi:hypothetical protein
VLPWSCSACTPFDAFPGTGIYFKEEHYELPGLSRRNGGPASGKLQRVVRAKGYLMISLSVYGDPGNALYAAVWLQRAGSAWVAIHGADAAAVAVVTQATLGS